MIDDYTLLVTGGCGFIGSNLFERSVRPFGPTLALARRAGFDPAG